MGTIERDGRGNPAGLNAKQKVNWKMREVLKYLVRFRFLYVFFGGLFFYLASITFDLIFIPILNMPDNWCQKWVERRIGYRAQNECVEFSDEVQKLKYRHNQKMEERFVRKMFGFFLLAVMLTFFIMLLSPYNLIDQKITFENYTGAIAIAIFYGVIIGFLLPTIFQALMPPSSEWLPNEFYEIQKARTELILKQISNGSG